MVHRRYRVDKEVLDLNADSEVDQPVCTRTPNNNARNYALEMSNGSTVLNEDQQSLVNKGKQKFRDEVSKRMGDLLLRGNTMLDAYCQVCNGILMEDRQKVRTCIQCDLYKELSLEKVPSVIAEIPLDYDADGFVPGNSHLAPKTPSTMKNVDKDNRMAIYETGIVTTYEESLGRASSRLNVEPKRGVTGTLRTITQKPRQQTLKTVPVSGNVANITKKQDNQEVLNYNGLHKVIGAIDEKMNWCAEKLNETEDVEQIGKLFDVVASGIRVLTEFKLSEL